LFRRSRLSPHALAACAIIAGNKSKSEKERKTGIKAIRYDERMEFEDNGIFDPKHASSVQRFDLRAVQSGPRALRKHLWNYIFSKLKCTPLPDSRTLYYETDSTAAWKFQTGKEFHRDLGTSHSHGESVSSQAFWLEFLCFHEQQGKSAIIRSKDGDCVPILLHAIELQERYAPKEWQRKPVYWMFKKDEIYEMRSFLAFIKKQYKLSESQYMIFCILCGTDFSEKKHFCNNFGVGKIFAALLIVKKVFELWELPLALGETQEQRDTAEECSLTTFARQLYQTAFTGTACQKGQLQPSKSGF